MSRRILLDAGPAQDFVQHRNPIYQRLLQEIRNGVSVGVCYPTLAELRGGFLLSANPEPNLKALAASFGRLERWPLTLDAVRKYGELFAALRRLGHTIGRIDMQVASIAQAMGSTKVVTYDNDLFLVPGLKVENWRKSQ